MPIITLSPNRRCSRAVWLVGAWAMSACNPNEPPKACEDVAVASVVVAEVFNDAVGVDGQGGTDAGREWLELYNASGAVLDLKDISITHSKLDGSAAKTHRLPATAMDAGGYLVLSNVADDLKPSFVDYGYGDELGEMYNSAGGRLVVACGDTIIDEAVYGPAVAGRSQQVSGAQPPAADANGTAESWCIATTEGSAEFVAGNFGTPGEANETCVSEAATTCVRNNETVAIQFAQPGDLVITEVMPSPDAVADADGEWFEVLVMRDLDLNGIFIGKSPDDSGRTTLTSESCLAVTAGTRLLFAHSADPAVNGNLPTVTATFTTTLSAGTSNNPGALVLGRGDSLIDAVTWIGASDGKSLQVTPEFESAEANDAASAWCDSDTAWDAGDLGSPGFDNNTCPLVPGPGECVDGSTIRNIVTPAVGQVVISEILANPIGTETDREFIELYAATAVDLNGLVLDKISGTSKKVFDSPSCISIPAGGYVVLARKADASINGGITDVLTTFGFPLSVTDSLRLRLDDVGMTAIDQVSFSGGAEGASQQLSSNKLTATDNDNISNWCNATTPYGNGDNMGTPGAANAACP